MSATDISEQGFDKVGLEGMILILEIAGRQPGPKTKQNKKTNKQNQADTWNCNLGIVLATLQLLDDLKGL